MFGGAIGEGGGGSIRVRWSLFAVTVVVGLLHEQAQQQPKLRIVLVIELEIDLQTVETHVTDQQPVHQRETFLDRFQHSRKLEDLRRRQNNLAVANQVRMAQVGRGRVATTEVDENFVADD